MQSDGMHDSEGWNPICTSPIKLSVHAHYDTSPVNAPKDRVFCVPIGCRTKDHRGQTLELILNIIILLSFYGICDCHFAVVINLLIFLLVELCTSVSKILKFISFETVIFVR